MALILTWATIRWGTCLISTTNYIHPIAWTICTSFAFIVALIEGTSVVTAAEGGKEVREGAVSFILAWTLIRFSTVAVGTTNDIYAIS